MSSAACQIGSISAQVVFCGEVLKANRTLLSVDPVVWMLLVSAGHTGSMDPVTALRQIAFYKDRAREESRRVMAYRNAADSSRRSTTPQREKHGKANSWQTLPGIGPKTAKVIAQAWAGREPDTLVELRSARQEISVAARSVPRSRATCTCTPTGRTGRRPSRR